MSMANFANGVKSFGIPLLGSGAYMSVRAAAADEIFFVDCINGSDNYNGEKPERAKKTIQAAVDLCNHDTGAMVFIGEGRYAEQVSVTKRGIKLIGMGPYSTQIIPATSMTAGDLCTPVLSINPTRRTDLTLSAGQVRNMPVEVCNMRISGAGGYSGLYIGDGADGLAQACGTIVHNCLIDGSNREGIYGVVIRGGSFIRVINNIIASWTRAGVVISAGATRIAYYNFVEKNRIISGGTCGVALQYKADSNQIVENDFCDDVTTGFTLAIQVGAVTGFGVCTGTKNAALRNFLACANGITLGASDYMSGNTESGNAGTSGAYITEE